VEPSGLFFQRDAAMECSFIVRLTFADASTNHPGYRPAFSNFPHP